MQAEDIAKKKEKKKKKQKKKASLKKTCCIRFGKNKGRRNNIKKVDG